MKNIVRSLAIIICSIGLSGCTSLGSYIVSNPDVYLSEDEFITADPESVGFVKHKYCSMTTSQCVAYLMASPYQPTDFSEGESVYYNLHSVGNGVENTISHKMTPETFNRFKGTAFILHGYGGKKEVMMATAIYFRAIGMKVIMPDLFGHGESQERFSFASNEHVIFGELLSQFDNDANLPTIVVGHSMGALPASKLLSEDKVSAAILLAPMMRFDLAAKRYLPYKAPTLNSFFSDHIDDIVADSMNDASVSLADMDLLSHLNKSNKPVLLINSNVDPVSPPDYFAAVHNKHVKKFVFNNRSHSSLMLFSKDDANVIEQWLYEL